MDDASIYRLAEEADAFIDEDNYYAAEPLVRTLVAGASGEALGSAEQDLAMILEETDRVSESEAHYRRAMQCFERAFGVDDEHYGESCSYLARVLALLEYNDEAEALFRRSLQILRKEGAEVHKLSYVGIRLAAVLNAKGLVGEAEAEARKALAIDEQRVRVRKADGAASYHEFDVARDLAVLAQILRGRDRITDAKAAIQKAIKINRACFGIESQVLALTAVDAASIIAEEGQSEAAETWLSGVITAVEASRFETRARASRALLLHALGNLLAKARRMNEAEELLRRALMIADDAFSTDKLHRIAILEDLAAVLFALDQFPEALTICWKSLDAVRRVLGDSNASVKRLIARAKLMETYGLEREAHGVYRQALKIVETNPERRIPEQVMAVRSGVARTEAIDG